MGSDKGLAQKQREVCVEGDNERLGRKNPEGLVSVYWRNKSKETGEMKDGHSFHSFSKHLRDPVCQTLGMWIELSAALT